MHWMKESNGINMDGRVKVPLSKLSKSIRNATWKQQSLFLVLALQQVAKIGKFMTLDMVRRNFFLPGCTFLSSWIVRMKSRPQNGFAKKLRLQAVQNFSNKKQFVRNFLVKNLWDFNFFQRPFATPTTDGLQLVPRLLPVYMYAGKQSKKLVKRQTSSFTWCYK